MLLIENKPGFGRGKIISCRKTLMLQNTSNKNYYFKNQLVKNYETRRNLQPDIWEIKLINKK